MNNEIRHRPAGINAGDGDHYAKYARALELASPVQNLGPWKVEGLHILVPAECRYSEDFEQLSGLHQFPVELDGSRDTYVDHTGHIEAAQSRIDC